MRIHIHKRIFKLVAIMNEIYVNKFFTWFTINEHNHTPPMVTYHYKYLLG